MSILIIRQQLMRLTMIAFLASGLASCTGEETRLPPARPKVVDAATADITAIADASNQFAGDLYHLLRRTPGNIAVSPYSIHTNLTLASAGALGTTLEQMRKALHHSLTPEETHRASATLLDELIKGTTEGDVVLRLASAIWLDKAGIIQDRFKTLAMDQYLAPVDTLPMRDDPQASVGRINEWTRKQTGGMIPSILTVEDITPETRLILTNAAYFSDRWHKPFLLDKTSDTPFHLRAPGDNDAADTALVKTMHTSGVFPFIQNSDVKAVRLPFACEGFSMMFILPRSPHQLAKVEAEISINELNRLADAMARVDLDVAIPRFRFSLELSLREHLRSLGMVNALDGSLAEFGGMTNEKNGLYLDDSRHKAVIVVDEQGAKAAAVTSSKWPMKDGEPPRFEPPKFIADQPFLFILRHDATGLILFAGRVSDPRE